MLFHAPISTWPFFSPRPVLQDMFEASYTIPKATYPLYLSELATMEAAKCTPQNACGWSAEGESQIYRWSAVILVVIERPTEQHTLTLSATYCSPSLLSSN